MLNTIFGDIIITVNEIIYEYLIIELSNMGKHFSVDKRYKLLVENINAINEDVTICCRINNNDNRNLSSGSDSGERLALISIFDDNTILSIGTEGDVDGIDYNYLSDGLSLRISKGVKIKSVSFMISWLETKDVKYDNNTWFAGDPDEI